MSTQGLLFSLVIVLVLTALIASNAAGNPAHLSIAEYTGPETCVGCHQDEAEDTFHSVHYQWTGPTPNVPNIAGDAGKGDGGFNTYCGMTESSRGFTCRSCHVSYGATPSSTMTPEQLDNIDCLMCHQDEYKRKAAGPFETVEYTDYLGVDHSWQLPIEDANRNFQYEPNEAAMSITILEAARTVHLPTRASCLRCHAYAAGSDCGKRGDLGTVTIDPPYSVDVHMSAAGANYTCRVCHTFADHTFAGRGLDLRPSDQPGYMDCTQCHGGSPHGSSRLNNHAVHVACQTCHIPTYAKGGLTTEMERDWSHPVWAAGLLGGQGGYKPEEVRASNVVPTYAWYDGTSQVYAVGQVAPYNAADDVYEFGLPNGDVASHHAQIMPMKEHLSNSARHDATGQIVPHATFTFFVTGDFSQAVADGMAWAGLTGSTSMVAIHTYQTINHGVEDHGAALSCGDCHSYYSGGSPVRLDLQGELGYALKGTHNAVCHQCHSHEGYPNFSSVHDKHVSSKHFDCAWCHDFTRPERGLTVPGGQDGDGDGVIETFDNCPGLANGNQDDADRDGLGDACDNCPNANHSIDQTDTDGDTTGDICDNCPNLADPNQTDSDGDAIGDACDDDDDNDGLPDDVDNCPLTVNVGQEDGDGDGVGDACDLCPNTLPGLEVDASGCPLPVPCDMDQDGDVDQGDYGLFQACLTGPGGTLTAPECQGALLDGDPDVDEVDSNLCRGCMTGSHVAGDPHCAD